MDVSTLERLRRPFERSIIKQRVGAGGRTLTYAPIVAYVERLLDAFGGAFSLQITSHEVLAEEVIVQVRIEAGGTVKSALGGAQITRRRDTGKPVSIAHDLMAAEATATKRACRAFGIGLDLYDDVDEHAEGESTPMAEPAQAPLHGGGRITSAQLAKIRALLAESGEDVAAFERQVRETHGVVLAYLDKRAGSRIIEELLGKSHRRRPNRHAPVERRAL